MPPTAGYSATPLASKLGLKPAMRACALGAPENYRELLVDVKVCAVDEVWSGLKLVIRRENR